jgi:hypothetical protein
MSKRISWSAALATVAGCIIFIVIVVDPIWTRLGLHVPARPDLPVNFTQPVDGYFYVQNAEHGYSWGSDQHLSIWFHPLLMWAIDLLPPAIPGNVRLWLVSVVSGVAALGLVRSLLQDFSEEKVNPWMIALISILPGGLAIATGNAEFPCLMFTAALLLSVLKRDNFLLPFLWGGLAVLTKPNALYMVPVLMVYLIHGHVRRDRRLAIGSLIGISAILLAFTAWVLFVDYQSHEFGAYWAARQVSIIPFRNGPFSLWALSMDVFLHTPDAGFRLKFASALFIPLVDLSLAFVISCRRQVDRIAMIAGIGAIIVSTFLLDNPTKVIVYMITLPAHFIVSLLFIREAFARDDSKNISERIVRRSAGVVYLCYCGVMLLFFVLGTPLRWYY